MSPVVRRGLQGMKIVHITAGAGGRICGSCLHDNALVRALRERGRDALLVPAYVPTTTDEENVAEPRIMCGGVNVWLQEHMPLFRHTPWWLDRMFDGRALLEWLSKRTGGATPAQVAGLTVSTLAGERGHQRKEVEKLARWLAADVRPDVVHLSNALLVGFARRIRELTGAAVVCSLSGEDVFVEKIPQPHYGEVRRLLRERSRDVDRFVALNEYFADFMSRYLDVPPTSIAVVPHGVDVVGFPPRPPDLAARRAARGGRRVVGFLARLCPEKGLDQALRALAQLAATHDVELLAAGATSAAEEGYLAACRRLAAELGVAERFRWLGQVDRPGKLELLRECDVFTMPTAHPEAKGLPVIEALAAGLPVVVPDHGTFPELVGPDAGILHAANDPRALAAGVRTVLDDPVRAASLGAAGHARARDRHTFATMAAGHEAVYAAAIAGAGTRTPRQAATSRAETGSDSPAPSR